MAKRIIEISVNDEYIVGSGVVIGAAGSHNDVVLKVTFNKWWRGLNIIATFHDARGENPVAVSVRMSTVSTLVEEGDDYEIHEFSIPHEVKKYEGKITLAFTGYTVVTAVGEDDNLIYQEAAVINTGTAYFNVLASNVKMADELFKNADVGQQILSDVNTLGGMYGDLSEAAAALKKIGEGIGDMKVDPDQNMLAHTLRYDNPHGVNRSQIGAAPAGYGLGEIGIKLDILKDAAKIEKTGWYRCTKDTVNGIGTAGIIEAVVNQPGYITLTGYVHGLLSIAYMSIKRNYIYNGEIGEWEWVNPPMIAGVEYRTTERWKGKTVYIRWINMGNLASEGQKSAGINISASEIVDYHAIIDNGKSAQLLPAMNYYGGTARVSFYIDYDEKILYCQCHEDMSKYTCKVVIKYTKD